MKNAVFSLLASRHERLITGTAVDDGARKSNNWRDQWQSGNWAQEVEFSPFRALSRRQMTFPFGS